MDAWALPHTSTLISQTLILTWALMPCDTTLRRRGDGTLSQNVVGARPGRRWVRATAHGVCDPLSVTSLGSILLSQAGTARILPFSRKCRCPPSSIICGLRDGCLTPREDVSPIRVNLGDHITTVLDQDITESGSSWLCVYQILHIKLYFRILYNKKISKNKITTAPVLVSHIDYRIHTKT